MSRVALPELPSRYPLGGMLPALYAADDFAQRFTSGLDAVLSAILSTLDNLPEYFDADLAPADFVAWLSSWVAADADPSWPEPLRREAVRRAVELHRLRGTAAGLVARLELCLGVRAEVVDGPGATWSTRPDTALPERREVVLVRVRPGRSGVVDRERAVALVDAACPLHVTCTVEVVDGG